VLLLDDDSVLQIGALRGFGHMSTEEIDHRLAAARERPAVQHAVREGVTVVVADEDVMTVGNPLDGPVPNRTWLGAPLRAGGQVIGLFAIQSVEDTSFGREDVDWVESLTAQAAAAIENARLHDRVRRHAAELEQRVAERTRDLSEAKEDAERANRA